MARKRKSVPTRPRGGVKTNTLYGPQFGRKDPARVEAGKKAAATRAAKKAQAPRNPAPSSSVPVAKTKNPARVEAGKKAAATRAANKARDTRKAKAMPTDTQRFDRASQKYNREFAKANKAPRGSFEWETNMAALTKKWHIRPPYGPEQVRLGIMETVQADYDRKHARRTA